MKKKIQIAISMGCENKKSQGHTYFLCQYDENNNAQIFKKKVHLFKPKPPDSSAYPNK